MLQDLRYALRALRSSPAFTFTALLLLTVGIGANAAIFSLASAVLLEPYPYEAPERIVTVHTRSDRYGFDYGNVSLEDFHDLRQRETGLEGVALYGYRSYNLASDEAAVFVPTAHVSADFFDVLGLEPLAGRTFLAGEDEPGNAVVVLDESVWRNELGGDPDVVGSELLRDGEPHTVVGIVPAGSGYPESRKMWKASLGEPGSEPRYRRVYRAVGRMTAGETLETVRSRLAAIGERLAREYPDSNADMGLVARTLREDRAGDVRPMLVVLSAAVGCLLLLVCANLANLMLVRSRRRRREMAIRSALGGGRVRILRQMVFESAALALGGSVLGVLFGQWTIRGLLALRPRPLPDWYEIGLDWRVMAFGLGAAALATLLFGLLPSLRLARGGGGSGLQGADSRASTSAGERRLLAGLIVCEIALSVVLLVGAGLTVRSFWSLASVDPGFELAGRLTVAVRPPASEYEPADTVRFVRRLERDLETLPGVEGAGSAALVPLMGTGTTGVIGESQSETEAEDNPSVQFSPVTPGFFEAIGMRLLEGRRFRDADDGEAEPVVIVSESLGRRLWPGGEPLGERLRIDGEDEWRRVVGVVADVRYAGLTGEERPQMYLPHAQDPWRSMGIVIHVDGDPLALTPAIREAIRALDPTIAAFNVVSLQQLYDIHTFEQRFTALLFWVFAAIAGLLASVGLYAVLAFAVARRTREIGIRKAVGAEGTDLVRMVVGEAGRLVGLGVVLGTGSAVLLSNGLASQLYGVDPHDLPTYLGVAALMCLVALAATLLPARAAARLDPVSALHVD